MSELENKMKVWLINWALEQLITRITLDEEAIVNYVNNIVDIPRMDEADEAKMFHGILRALKSFIKGS